MQPHPAIGEATPRPTVLIVEDEPMLAFVLEEVLADAGFDVIGVAQRLPEALALIECRVFDAAILDANLAGQSAGPAAAALVARGVPFIVLSGYLPAGSAGGFAGGLRLQKPCRSEHLLRALHDILAGQYNETACARR